MIEPNNNAVRTALPSRGAVAPIRRPAPANLGLIKETARVTILPTPPVEAEPAVHGADPVALASASAVHRETIPRSLCWFLAAISGVIFLIQIWNYVVS